VGVLGRRSDVEVGRPSGQVHRTAIGSQQVNLPIVPISPDLAIALLVVPDHGVRFLERAGRDLAEEVAPLHPQIVAGTATQGVAVAIELTRALGLDDYLVLQKTQKINLTDALTQPLRSITTAGQQHLLLDRVRAAGLAGQRVVLVDDVVSTGGSIAASLRLLREAGAEVVAVGALLTEAGSWRESLGADADLVRALGAIPLFTRAPATDRADGDTWQAAEEPTVDAVATPAPPPAAP